MVKIFARLGAKVKMNNAWKDISGKQLFAADNSGFEGINLSRLHLDFADLSGKSLKQANLYRSFLGGADLECANLTRTDLSYAHLAGANLKKAVLLEADLSNATLFLAELQGTNLESANLSGARFESAYYDVNTRWPLGFDPIKAGATIAGTTS